MSAQHCVRKSTLDICILTDATIELFSKVSAGTGFGKALSAFLKLVYIIIKISFLVDSNLKPLFPY